MNRIVQAIVMTSAVLTLSSAASWSAGPPNNDVSDDFGNAAGGTNALVNTTPSNPFPYNGTNNTAFGNNTLSANTTGYYNTATGADALSANRLFSNKGTFSLVGIEKVQCYQFLKATSGIQKFSVFGRVRKLAKLLKIHIFFESYESFRSYVGIKPTFCAPAPAGPRWQQEGRSCRRGSITRACGPVASALCNPEPADPRA